MLNVILPESGHNHKVPRSGKNSAKKVSLFPNSIAIGIKAHEEALKMGASLEIANQAIALGIASFLQVGKQEQLPDIDIANSGRLMAELVMAGQPVPFTWQQIFEQQLQLINTSY